MTPSLFAGTSTVDEFTFCTELGDKAAAVIDTHRKTFITESDIAWIAASGLNAVRLPVPHWIFGGYDPYLACDKYVDWFLDMCHQYGLRVLLQLHTAPGSQNGHDHSGRQGDIGWPKKANRQQTSAIMSQIVERYADHPAVVAFGLLNEPDYHISHRQLRRYYQDATNIAADHAAVSVWSDAFRPLDWLKDLKKVSNQSVWLDCHLYQAFGQDQSLTYEQHRAKVQNEWVSLINRVQQVAPVIIGEWSAATHRTLEDEQRHGFIAAQLRAFQSAVAWFYWSYKTETHDNWNFRYLYESGQFPDIAATI